MVWESNSNGREIFHTCPDQPCGQPASYTVGSGTFLGVKQTGMALTTHPYLAPRLRKE